MNGLIDCPHLGCSQVSIDKISRLGDFQRHLETAHWMQTSLRVSSGMVPVKTSKVNNRIGEQSQQLTANRTTTTGVATYASAATFCECFHLFGMPKPTLLKPQPWWLDQERLGLEEQRLQLDWGLRRQKKSDFDKTSDYDQKKSKKYYKDRNYN